MADFSSSPLNNIIIFFIEHIERYDEYILKLTDLVEDKRLVLNIDLNSYFHISLRNFNRFHYKARE